MAIPQKLISSDLIRLIHRYNFGYCIFGTAVLITALALWIATVYVSIFFTGFITLPYFGSAEMVLSILFLCGIAGIGFSNTALFFAIRSDTDFPILRKTFTWSLAVPGWTTLLWTTLCIAPILTVWGITIFRQCFSYDSKRIGLACTLYVYLKDCGDWVPYPKFESQRQAVILLYHLGLVRISCRFGTLQIKLTGGKTSKKAIIHG
jgi:hypothetical protein